MAREDASAPAGLQVFHLWPENARTWALWLSLQNDWRSSMAGREGLDKHAVELEMKAHRIRPTRWRQVWGELRLMEQVSLKVWDEQAREASKKQGNAIVEGPELV